MEIKYQNEAYKRKRAIRSALIFVIFVCLLLLSLVISMNTGYTRLSVWDTFRTLFGSGSAKENLILFDLRLPRIVLSILVGAGLATSGCIIQGITKNPLADPGLLGINAGAGLMVVLFVLFVGTKSFLAVFTLPYLALIGAVIAAILIYTLAYKRYKGVSPIRLILTGVAVHAGISAFTTLLVVKMDETQYEFVATWQAGSVWGTNWLFVLSLLPWLLVLLPYALYKARTLDVLNLGDDPALGLGAPVEKERRKLLFTAVALAASCVAVSGNISFVGLLAPHIARRLVGPKHSILLPTAAVAGGVLLSAADTVARVIVQPSEIPAGLMVAILGAPYFLYLLAKSK